MRSSAMLLLALALASGCASTAKTSYVEDPDGPRQVSVSVLQKRAGEFDGQSVRVLGVASFNPGNDARSALYATGKDARRSTDSYIEIGSLSPPLSAALEALNGRPVVIDGTFRARPLNKLPQRPGAVVECVGGCRTLGVLEDVTQVGAPEP